MTSDAQLVLDLGRAAVKVLSHSKFLTLSSSAGWLWIRALVYLTAGNGTLGGLVTADALKELKATPRHAQELVDAGLWRKDQYGWRVIRLNAAIPAPQPKPERQVVQQIGTEVMRFDVDGEPGFWILTKEFVDRLQRTYRTVNVLEQCHYAKAWIDALPSRRKTFRGMPKFLNSWMMKAIDRRAGGVETPRGRTGPAPAGKYDKVAHRDEEKIAP